MAYNRVWYPSVTVVLLRRESNNDLLTKDPHCR